MEKQTTRAMSLLNNSLLAVNSVSHCVYIDASIIPRGTGLHSTQCFKRRCWRRSDRVSGRRMTVSF